MAAGGTAAADARDDAGGGTAAGGTVGASADGDDAGGAAGAVAPSCFSGWEVAGAVRIAKTGDLVGATASAGGPVPMEA
ncbi:hypothetical protein QFZ65_001980 [Arthrobacter sp. B3I9]|nr:hypothetical protein [Arthrobacter sp. B3I9]